MGVEREIQLKLTVYFDRSKIGLTASRELQERFEPSDYGDTGPKTTSEVWNAASEELIDDAISRIKEGRGVTHLLITGRSDG